MNSIPEALKVYGLAVINVPLGGAQIILSKIAPILSVILILAQIAVAVATVVYTVKKIRSKKKGE